jgi:hypothetical protein
MAQVQEPGQPIKFGLHRHQTNRVLREIMCRRCGRWMTWHLLPGAPEPETYGAGGRWWHTDDKTQACVDPDTLAPYPDEVLWPTDG